MLVPEGERLPHPEYLHIPDYLEESPYMHGLLNMLNMVPICNAVSNHH